MSDYRRTLTQKERRLKAPPCQPRDFRTALRLLGFSQVEAAERLGAASEFRISDWCRGALPVPMYIQRHLRTLLGLGPADPWPTYPMTRWPVVLPQELRPRLPSSGRDEECA